MTQDSIASLPSGTVTFRIGSAKSGITATPTCLIQKAFVVYGCDRRNCFFLRYLNINQSRATSQKQTMSIPAEETAKQQQ